jgi:hypothetical protein
MGRTCGTYGRQERCIQDFWWEDLMERNHLEDLAVDGDSINIDLQDVGWRDMDWIDLAQDRNRWRALVDAVMNIQFQKIVGIS